jgi:hypothetical protein
MSYDLSFRSPSGAVDLDAVRRWFSARPGYTVAGDRAWYENRVSGVYFSFQLGPTLSFSLNYFRPDLFAREAEEEVSAVIAAFDLRLEPDRAWSPAAFLAGWREGNRRAHAVLAERETPVLTLPQATNLGVWRWNRAREGYLDRLASVEGRACFVPTLFLLVPEGGGPVRTAVVWAEHMPLALPEVDLVLALNEPGGRPLAIPLDALRPALATCERRDGDLPHWFVDDPSAELLEILDTAGRFVPFRRVDPGEVLDRETYEAACASRSPRTGEA